jgi:hypothetical protein
MSDNLPIHEAFANKIKAMYGKSKGGTSLIGNPIKSFKTLKAGAKLKGEKHATLYALGIMARVRVANGPELNIVLMGIPFLIDFGISYGTGKFKKKGVPAFHGHSGKAPIELKFMRRSEGNSEVPVVMAQAVPLAPLPSAPYAEQALILYKAFVDEGMSEEGARKITSGEFEGQEVADFLSDQDLRVFVRLIGTRLVAKTNVAHTVDL